MATLRRVKFLFSRRWILFALVVAAAAWGATELGQWQFHRLDERRHDNTLVARNLERPPVPVEDVLSVQEPVSHEEEWRRVTARGTWDDEHTIVLKYQTRGGKAGVDVVTPLVTEDGTAVLVDRGWMATENTGGQRPETPAVVSGPVTVTGWVRANGTGSSTRVSDLSTRALSSEAIAEVVPYPLMQGFLDLDKQSPPPDEPLEAHELPETGSEGPHFFYGLQWWFFGALAVFGFGYLAWDERRMRREAGEASAGSERTEHAAVHGQHRPGDEA
jgi:cytochrome oxidase assembly protein ShyY1